ncbi:MAG TPA: efflux RND transporter periplasmic adaptor subunit [Candidatus Moranbacteria bacterium]|jgi:macrolide-specific efflux system membrane fusion protein|nr:efflux RND transporter periplasmic adaptor subunit [Candidatus Moranbacteria bacterium]
MNRIKNIIIPVSIVVLLAVLAGVSFASSQSNQTSNKTSPQRGDITDQLKLSGNIQPENTLDLGFERAGKVSKIYVKVGDNVKKGQLLAELNPEETNISYAQAISDQRVAEAQLAQAKDDKDAQKAKLKSVEKSSTANKYDEKAQKEVVNQSDSNINAKEALLQKANEAVQNTKVQGGKTKLYAPTNGTITKQSLEEGEIISSYTSAISLIGDGTLEIQAYVSEIEVAKISLGAKAMIKIDANQKENLDATVSAIDPVETNSANVSSYKVTLIPSFSIDKLKSGMMVDIILNLGEKKNTLIIPTQSVFEENGKSFVLTIANGIQTKKEIQLGANDQAGKVEVLSGIGEQDEIVSFNQSK